MKGTMKMNSRDKLTALLLEQCMKDFDSVKGTNGRWPERAIIVLKDGFHHKFFGLGKPTRAWVSDGCNITEIDTSEAANHLNTESNRMYYRVARFTLAFPDDLSTARLTESFGPRFGGIYLYDVLCDCDEVSLGERHCEGMI